MRTAGIHHVTAICGDAQRNVDFYAGVLGLRLVKRTVNFDDPQTHHLYYGDEVGHPGSLITFFPWPGAERGRVGPGQVAVTSFAVAPNALGFWIERLLRHGVKYIGPNLRRAGDVDEQVLAFEDRVGTVHHVAWRVIDDRVQLEMREGLVAAGLDPTPVIDRQYFHSVYFLEPGGVLFELATDGPGFAIDESVAHLGEQLMLPPRYEPARAQLAASLPEIHAPTPAGAHYRDE